MRKIQRQLDSSRTAQRRATVNARGGHPKREATALVGADDQHVCDPSAQVEQNDAEKRRSGQLQANQLWDDYEILVGPDELPQPAADLVAQLVRDDPAGDTAYFGSNPIVPVRVRPLCPQEQAVFGLMDGAVVRVFDMERGLKRYVFGS